MASAFSSVVLPDPVPPETMMFLRARTQASSIRSIGRVSMRFCRSMPIVRRTLPNLRMVRLMPSSAVGLATIIGAAAVG